MKQRSESAHAQEGFASTAKRSPLVGLLFKGMAGCLALTTEALEVEDLRGAFV